MKLAKLRVIDLSSFLPGPYLTMTRSLASFMAAPSRSQ